ncbi:hypothetical protein D7S86_03690 [Pararobbsia silviterrae]|uniref:Uncharacterized protein n=1 Tax=Pararobbsia silviterrae TaxID=1792498 RepID=A0A494YA45_9BURK|nr:hypothetical protein D7S86_03690 [Pararobbsia silviterrae]
MRGARCRAFAQWRILNPSRPGAMILFEPRIESDRGPIDRITRRAWRRLRYLPAAEAASAGAACGFGW